jgi:glycine cleavage system H protein
MEIFFTRDHEWIKIEDGSGTVGITDYAVQQLGDITFVELPKIGREVEQSAVLSVVESVKAASDIFAPLRGRVAEVNVALESNPEIVNHSPEDEGWIARLDISDSEGVKALMSRSEYDEYVRSLT